MSSRQNRNLLQFLADFVAKLRKWLIRTGSPFRISRRLVRDLQSSSRRKNANQAGFVLPVVVLVTAVTTLAVVTVVSNSAQRAETAANSRIEQVLRSTNTPLIDRARAKIAQLLADDRLPRTTPSDFVLNDVLQDARYTYDDEIRLVIADPNIDGNAASVRIDPNNVANTEALTTAWKFPIDTDGNGRFDSFGLYSIIYRARPIASASSRATSLMEARGLPQDQGALTDGCVGASANVATTEGWIDSNGRLKKAFFAYAVTVPITDPGSINPSGDPNSIPGRRAADPNNYEQYRGISSISALELQQDRERFPLNNNAVFFESDLEITRTPAFRLNGRVYTSGNLLVRANPGVGNEVTFYQVSASDNPTTTGTAAGSCYYRPENAKVLVAGNAVIGDATSATGDTGTIRFDLFLKDNGNPETTGGGRQDFTTASQSVADNNTNRGRDVLSNDAEFSRRIEVLVRAAIARGSGTVNLPGGGTRPRAIDVTYPDPESVRKFIADAVFDEGLTTQEGFDQARRRALQAYFRERTRKVPNREVSFTQAQTNLATCDSDANAANGLDLICPTDPTPLLTVLTIDGGTELRPPIEWAFPLDQNGGALTRTAAAFGAALDGAGLVAGNPALQVNVSGNLLDLPANDPTRLRTDQERLLGDRVNVGNNLPARWLRNNGGRIFFATNRAEIEDNRAPISTANNIFWNDPTNPANALPAPRYRVTQAEPSNVLGEVSRGGFWEISAASNPANPLDPTEPRNSAPNTTPTFGGLRVITNAGIYTRLRAPGVTTDDAPGTFLPRYHTNLLDSPVTGNIDESAAPKDNPNTPFNEARFAGVAPVTATEAERARVNFVVWPDSMPMTEPETPPPPPPDPVPRKLKGDLQMRASAIYHYKFDAFDPASPEDYQRPLACVSSYYDPSYSYVTNPFSPISAANQLRSSALNRQGLPFANLPDALNGNETFVDRATGRSNNGVVYNVGLTAGTLPPLTSTFDGTTGQFSVVPGAENPANTAIGAADRLAYQANLIFPNGRFANEPLRAVLRKVLGNGGNFANANLTIVEQATIDANLCALQIADGTIAPQAGAVPVLNGAQLPHGLVKESAFLDGREVKTLNRNEYMYPYSVQDGPELRNVSDNRNSFIRTGSGTATNGADVYDLEVEQRQPLEIRATDLDLDKLRSSTITGANNAVVGGNGIATEYILPYSGLVYATREDASTDTTSSTAELSATDFVLDPTRHPSAIRLVNGYSLWRRNGTGVNTQSAFTAETRGEKGLILVTNIPAYLKAQRRPAGFPAPTNTGKATALPDSGFNVHTHEEFTEVLAANWSNFYTRAARDRNFACRPGQFAGCTEGDNWRVATVLADAFSVQSADFRDGYRSDGDYDLRNNADTSTSLQWNDRRNPQVQKIKDSSYVIDRRRKGFYDNSFVTSANFLTTVNSDGGAGSTSPLYPQGNRSSFLSNGVTPIQRRILTREYSMEICRKLPVSECRINDWEANGAGTTALPDATTYGGTEAEQRSRPRYIAPADYRYARRLAFLRFDDIYGDGNQALVMSARCPMSDDGTSPAGAWPIPIGVRNQGNSTNAGNQTDAYTYPHIFGSSQATPFRSRAASDNNNFSAYGDVPCAVSSAAVKNQVQINSNVEGLEGREQGNPSVLAGNLPAPSNSNVLAGTGTGNGNPGSPTVYRRLRFRVNFVPQSNPTITRTETVRLAIRTIGVTATPADQNPNTGALGPSNPVIAATNGPGRDYLPAVYRANAFDNPAVDTNVICSTLTPPPGSSCQFLEIPATANFADFDVLVVRDSFQEPNEQFQVQLVGVAANSASETELSPDAGRRTRTGTIQQTSRVGGTRNRFVRFKTVLSKSRQCPNNNIVKTRTPFGPYVPDVPSTEFVPPSGFNDDGDTQLPADVFRNGPDIDKIPDPPAIDCPAPPSGGGGTGGTGGSSGMLNPPTFAMVRHPRIEVFGLPFGGVLPQPAAAYPFPEQSATPSRYPACDGAVEPQIDYQGAPNTGATRCVTQGAAEFPVRSLFGRTFNDFDATSQPVLNSQLPPPNSPVIANNNNSGRLPMLPGMTTAYPNFSDRALWFRTTGRSSYPGESNTARFNWDGKRALYLFQSAWPQTGGNNSNNPLHPDRLVLPDTVCIDSRDGFVDATCERAEPAGSPAGSVIANLNLPANPLYPDNNANIRPASTFAICGATGRSQKYQSRQALLGGNVQRNDFTDNSCPTNVGNPRAAIVRFFNTLNSPAFDPAQSDTTFQGIELVSTVPAGSDPLKRSASVVLTEGTSEQPQTVVLTAANTYSNNRVNVFSFSRASLGVLNGGTRTIGGVRNSTPIDSSTTVPSRANSGADALTDQFRGVTLTLKANPNGPSPVFILRGDPTENLTLSGVRLKLEGVEPNNVFWLTPRVGSNDAFKLESIPAQPTLRDVRVATTANIPNLTNVTSVDGVTLTQGDRILVKNQTDPAQNGIYTINVTGGNNVAERAADFDESATNVVQGVVVRVFEGTTNANRFFKLSNDPFPFGTSPKNFALLPERVAAVENGNVNLADGAGATATTGGIRVLLTGQNDRTQNGVYNYPGPGSALTRVDDLNETSEVSNNRVIPVLTSTSIELYKLTNPTVTLGTTELTYEAFNSVPATPSILAGNFIGRTTLTGDNTIADTTTLTIGDKVALRGVRFLGYRSSAVNENTVAVAMTTTNEPLTVPVIHFQVPSSQGDTTNTGTQDLAPSINDGTRAINGTPSATNGLWSQRALASEINVYTVAGTTPSRSFATVNGIGAAGNIVGETGGGLPNFVRFMENWAEVPLNVAGGFLQNTRSQFATAPFAQTGPFPNPNDTENALVPQSLFINALNNTTFNDRLGDFDNVDATPDATYRSETLFNLPYYTPPQRNWGFDVGLLTQAPDRFAERFSRDLPNFSDFFRETDRNDPYVATLLCAAEPVNPNAVNPGTASGTGVNAEVNLNRPQRTLTRFSNYTRRALQGQRDLPNNCFPTTYVN